MPVSPDYRPEPRFFDLGADYADAVQAADFPQTILRFRNDRAAAEVGLAGGVEGGGGGGWWWGMNFLDGKRRQNFMPKGSL